MKFKKSLLSLSPLLIVVGSIALSSQLIIDDNLEKAIVNESSSAIEFVDEMNDIYASPNVDYDGEVVDYFSIDKQYELQNDVDFAGVENLYDGTMNVSLIDNSSFNGNGYSIQNRWDSDQFETYFNNSSNVRGITYMNDFDEVYSSTSIPIYLFNPFQNVDVYNLTFDNSPFAFAGASSSSFVNVNMTNIDIENVDIVFNWTETEYSIDDINSFNMALFMYQTDMDFVWKSSYVNNVTIANNTFDFSNVIPTEVAGSFPYDVDVKLGLVGKAMKATTISNMVFQDLEFTNWNISNNQILVSSYTDDIYVNDPNLKITPFVMVGGKSFAHQPSEGHYSEPLAQDSSSRELYEDDIDISQIYFHNWVINDNVFIDTSNSTTYNSVNFSVGPNINNDDVLNIDFSSIYLDNIQSNQEFIGDAYYYDLNTNTIISYSNTYILNSSELVSNAFGETFDSSSLNSLDDPTYKASVFDPQFWDIQSEDLALQTTSSLGFDSNVKYDWTNGTPQPYFSFDLEPNNFWVEQLDINLVDQDQNVIYSNSIQNNESIRTWNGSNEIFELDLSMFSTFILSSLDTYTLSIDFSQYNDKYQYSFILDASDDFLIYDFENAYSNGVLNYDFSYIDPYNEITSFDLSLYNKNKLVFEDNIPTSSTEQYLFTSTEISGSHEVSIDNLSNYYFVFDVNTLNSQGEHDYHLTPQPQSPDASFVLGNDTYINDFKTSPNTWMDYYWWVILVLVFVILILLAISMLVYFYFKAQKNERNVEKRIKEYAEEHGIALSEFYNHSQQFPSQSPMDYEQNDQDDSYEQNNHDDYYDQNNDYNSYNDQIQDYNNSSNIEESYSDSNYDYPEEEY